MKHDYEHLSPSEQRDAFFVILRKDLARLSAKFGVSITWGPTPSRSVWSHSFPAYPYVPMRDGYCQAVEMFDRWWRNNYRSDRWLSVERNPWDENKFDLVVIEHYEAKEANQNPPPVGDAQSRDTGEAVRKDLPGNVRRKIRAMNSPSYKVEVEKLCKGAWGVTFIVEHQSFVIGSDAWDTLAEAQWFARQFEKAIDKLAGVYRFRGRGPKVKIKRK